MTSLRSLDRDSARISFSIPGSHSISSLLPKVTKDSFLYRSQSRWKTLQSWRAAITLYVLSAGLTLFVNLALTIWASTKGFEGGIATIQEGDCNMTKRLDLWLHLGINLLSTILLGASNYTMQCLSAPTRDEINKAHQQRIYLDIGVPSVRNLGRISQRRRRLWWLLALSSIPLHFMYNSAVFSTLSTHPYTVAVVSHDFLTDAPFTNVSSGSRTGYSTLMVDVPRLTQLRENRSELQNLTNENCLKAYRKEILPDRLDVLAVSSATNINSSLLSYWPDNVLPLVDMGPGRSPYAWTCTQTATDGCTYPTQDWTINDCPIEYCLSGYIEPICKVQLSSVIMIIVILCNFAKVLCMSLTIWKPSSIPLLTLGDAIASFLDQTDPNTADNCLASKYYFRGVKNACLGTSLSGISKSFGPAQDSIAANYGLLDKNQHSQAGWDGVVRIFKPGSYRWYHSTSLKRWLLCISLCTLTLITASILLGRALNYNVYLRDNSMAHLWSLGYGGVNSETTIRLSPSLSGGLISMILLANLPQVILSFLYLTYNALFTSMLLAEEWSGFAHQRKTLRVTRPVRNQRSTYRLQLPYFYGIPLLIMSGILHWLVSQSLFVVRIAVEADYTSYYGDSYYTRAFHLNSLPRPGPGERLLSACGWSPIAIITVIPLGALLLLVVIANGFRKYKDGMPLAGSCSAAISAACHRPEEDVDASVLPVQWGAVSTEGPIGHCCFTSFEVSTPVHGEPYADREDISPKDTGASNAEGCDQRSGKK